jgi:hypothetical protein
MRKLITITIAVSLLFALVGCGSEKVAAPTGLAPNQTAEAYAYVHGGYVGQVVVTTDAEGAINATIDEAFLPHTLALVDIESAEWNEDNTVTYVLRGDDMYLAKYVAYQGNPYVGEVVGNTLVFVPAGENGEPAGSPDLEMMILRNEASMAEWFNSIDNGSFEIFTEWGGDGMAVTTTSYGGLKKRGSTYWNFGLTWEGNMDAIAEAAALHGVSYSLDEIAKDGDTWALADATTAATASDFKDYFALIQLATARLEFARD